MSKPEIIIQDFGGINNSDLTATKARLTRGGSWKQQNIIVLMPATEVIYAKVVLSWLNLGFPPNNGVVRMLALGQEVGEAYSNCIEQILADPNLSKFQYILTLEADNAPPSDGVLQLVECMENHPELSCVGGLYFTKGPGAPPIGPDGKIIPGAIVGGGCAQIWGNPRLPEVNFMPQLPDPNGGLVECCGTGMGFNLFRLDMFKDIRIPRPWFKTQTKDGMMTQDLFFWRNARKFGYRCAILCSCRVGHHDGPGKFGPADFMY